jgi:hypothetical protein
MFMKFVRGAVASAVLVAMSLTAASAVTLTFNNNGGNGVGTVTSPSSFTMTGNNNNVSGLDTVWSGMTGATGLTVTGSFGYSTADRRGSAKDTFSYFIGNVFTLLSSSAAFPAFQSGPFTLVVPANTLFGWVIKSPDGKLGAASVAIYTDLSAVPLPAGGLLLVGALGGLSALRRRKAVALV